MRVLVIVLAAAGLACGEDWPCFRGPTRQGVSTERNIPVKLDRQAWAAEVPGEGWSSPVVWKEYLFLTTATDEGRTARVLAFHSKTGKLLWNREVFAMKPGQKEKKNSWATPTPVTDGRAVYTVFGDGSFAALDFSGKVLWTNREYPHYSQHGLGASLVLAGGLLIHPRDGSNATGDLKLGWQKPWDQSFVLALDPKTGVQRWKAHRGMSRIAHVTPNVAGNVLVSGAGDVVQGFDLASGKLLWTARSQGEGVVPSVVLGSGVAFTVSGFEKPAIRAVRMDGTIAWEQTKGVPMVSSLLYDGSLLYAVTTNGIVSALKAEKGELVSQQRIGGEHGASPVLAGGHLYFCAEDGTVTVVKAGPELGVVAANPLNERIQASPAISNGLLYIRTAQRLLAYR